MTGKRIVVLASGRGSDLQSILDARAEGRIESDVVAVISDNAEAKALARARRKGAEAIAVEPDASLSGSRRREAHGKELLGALEEQDPDLVVLAGYMRILGPGIVRAFEGRVVNIHPGLLPSFPGLGAQQQALDRGVRIAGCTTHFVDEKVDHGPIILQAAVVVQRDDDHDSLARRILGAEHQILPRTVHLFEQGRLRIDGRRVVIDADGSWTERYPTLEGVLYGPGY